MRINSVRINSMKIDSIFSDIAGSTARPVDPQQEPWHTLVEGQQKLYARR